MSSNRRNFLLSGPAALFAFDQFAELAEAQTPGSAKGSADVADFWSRGMGVPENRLIGGAALASRGRSSNNMGSGTNFAREPLFLYWDNDEKALMTASEIDQKKLPQSGDAKVDFRLLRMRLNGNDDKIFQSFTSGGIYLDMSQQEAASKSSDSSWITTLATPIFAALFPSKSSGKSGGASPGGESGGKSTGGGSTGGGSTGGKTYLYRKSACSDST